MNAHEETEPKYFTGVFTDLSNENYHDKKDSISRSALMDFKRNPKRYFAKNLDKNRPKNEATANMEFGTAFHTLILEPNLFDENYIVKPEPVLLRDVGKESYEKYKEAIKSIENSKKNVLSQTDFEKLRCMQIAINANGRAKELIESAVYESSYFWEDEESGLIVKSRPDILHDKIYVDLKSVTDASPHVYQREMAAYGYHIQAAMVCDGVLELQERELLACINICVEKTYPYSIGIYIIDEEAIKAGRAEYKSLLLDLKQCILNNDFPDYEPQTISLPRWYL